LNIGNWIYGDSGNITFTGDLTVNNSGPYIKMLDSDTDKDDFFLHTNNDVFYILTDRNDDGDFADTVAPIEWPAPLTLSNATKHADVYGSKVVTAASFSLVGTVLTITI
jgi:hypothetical protein